MPSILDNKKMWNEQFDWERHERHWADFWGNPEMEWRFCIYPRIAKFFPVETLLEIGPGYGRWTQYLIPLCKKIYLIDLSQKCIDVCQEKFRDFKHISYFVNDGMNLDMIPENSIDFVFSFDSLVHAEKDVLQAYFHQLEKKMRSKSFGFIHHSNLGSVNPQTNWVQVCMNYFKTKLFGSKHWRAKSVSSQLVQKYIADAGLFTLSQELVNWGKTRQLIDCISLFGKEKRSEPVMVYANPNFMNEAKQIKKLSGIYGRTF